MTANTVTTAARLRARRLGALTANHARGLVRALRVTIIGGAGPAPPLPAQPAWLRPAVRVTLVAATMVAGLLTLAQYPYFGGLAQLALVAGVLPLAVCAYRPLLAWRISWLLGLGMILIQANLQPWWMQETWVGPIYSPYVWSTGQVMAFLAALLAVGTVATRGVLLWVGAFSLGLGMVAVAPPGVDHTSLAELLESGAASHLALAGLVVGSLAAGHLLRQQVDHRHRLAAAEERGTVLTERARIAQELHDVVAHRMSMIAVQAETAPYRLADLPDAARTELAEIAQASRETMNEMRHLLGVLRSEEPAPTTPQPGLGDLAELVASARAAGASVTVDIDAGMPELPAAVSLTGYRIVQEALSNATRHAPGAAVQVVVGRAGASLSVLVRNSPARAEAGASGSAPAGTGHGLRGMRERVVMLGGSLQATPTGDGGFEVSAILPLVGERR